MKKTIRDIVITFAVMGVICFALRRIGWLASMREAGLLFAITGVVIVVDLAASWIWKKLSDRQ